MATWYVDSAAAGTGAGTSWVNAKTTLAAAITASAAGDDFNVKSTHAETTASNATLTFKGTAASPNRVFSCGTTNSPATASDLTAGATFTTTAGANLNLSGHVYIYGMTFSIGTGANFGANIKFGQNSNSYIYLQSCTLKILSTSVTQTYINTGGGGISYTYTVFDNTTVQFSNASQNLSVAGNNFTWINTPSAIQGATLPTTLLGVGSFGVAPGNVVLDGVDLSALGSGKTLIDGSSYTFGADISFINCKLGSSVTVTTRPANQYPAGPRIMLLNCDSGATNNRNEMVQYAGTLTTETVVVQTSPAGATDGTTPHSWKVVTTANAKAVQPFECFEIDQWVDTTGSSKTATIQCITDNVVLTNADIWVDAQVLQTSSFPLASRQTSAPATQLTAGSNLTTSSSTWTTTGFGSAGANAKPQQFAVTFTTTFKGYVRFVVKVAKASATVYIDPLVTIA